MSTLGKRLRTLRNNKKLTQKELGNVLKASESTIGMYERDERKPDYETLLKISDFFEVSTDYLLRGETYRETAERIVDDPGVRVAASDGEFSKEEKIKMLEWLLEAERGRKPGDKQKRKK